MNELHLFAGVGGGILGGILLGHTTVCAVEIEPYCRRVLLQRQRDGILPKFPIWDDVCTFDGKPWRGKVDVVCGGFPCQDISCAGGGQDCKEIGADCGEKWQGSLAKYDPDTSSWKTAQCLLFGDLEESLEKFPNWGIMLNGELWELPIPDFLTEENEYGSWVPTPTASMWRGAARKRFFGSQDYKASFTMEWIRTSKDCDQYFDPVYAEALMGFPIKWTDLKPLEMHKFQLWLEQHSES